MKIKYIMIISLLLVILTIGTVSATDNATSDNLTVSEETVIESDIDLDEKIGIENQEILSATPGNFSQLREEIGSAEDEFTLTRDYTYSDSDSGNIPINKKIIINGNGYTIDCRDKNSVFDIASNDVTIKNIKIINTNPAEGYSQSAIHIGYNTNVTILNCTFINTKQTYRDGAIKVFGTNTKIINCTFINGTTAQESGAIYIAGPNTIITNCTFINNTNNINGAAIYGGGDNTLIENSTFINNKGNSVRAINIGGNNVTIKYCTIEDPDAKYFTDTQLGGMIINCTLNGELINPKQDSFRDLNKLISDTETGTELKLTKNYTYSTIDTTNIPINKKIIINGNGYTIDCSNRNSAFQISSANVILKNIKIINTNPSDGFPNAAIHIENKENITIINCTIINSKQVYFDGVIKVNAPNTKIINCTIINCTTTQESGAIYVNNQNITITNCTFINNTNNINGAAIRGGGDNTIIENSTFINNKDKTINIGGNNVTIKYCTIEDRTSQKFEEVVTGGTVIDCIFNGKIIGGPVPKTFADLQNDIDNAIGEFNFTRNYAYADNDTEFVTISKTITINGNGLAIDANNLNRAFHITADNVVVKNIIFRNCANETGGAIRWEGNNGIISNCTFENCHSKNGGAIYSNCTNGTVSNCRFINCSADEKGSAVYWIGNDGKIEDSTFVLYDDKTSVYVVGDNVEIINAEFESRIAEEIENPIEGAIISNCSINGKTITKKTTQISINVIDIAYGEKQIVNVTMTANATGSISIILSKDGNILYNVSANPKNGTASYEFSNLKTGLYDVNVVYLGDKAYSEANASDAFSVLKLTPQIKITTEDATYGEKQIVNVTMTANATGSVKITLAKDNETLNSINANLENGIASYAFTDLIEGTYEVNVTYSGDDIYCPITGTESFKVSRITPEIRISAEDIIYGENQNVNVELPSDATGNVNIELAKASQSLQNITKALSNGIASNRFAGLDIGVYTLSVRYGGDLKYNEISQEKKFTVRPEVHIAQDACVGDKVKITIDVFNVTGTIVVSVDSMPRLVQEIEENGFAGLLPTEKLTAGTHNVTFQYYGDESFDKNVFNIWDSQTNSYTPMKYQMKLLPMHIVIPDQLESNDNGTATIELPIDAKGTLEVYVNGKEYATFDVEKELGAYVNQTKGNVSEILSGMMNLDLSSFKDGDYRILLKYSGDDVYAGFTKEIKVHFKVSRITASNVNVLYTQAGKFTAKVYDSDGKLVDGINVEFLINGKTYKTATTKNGAASVSISKTPGTYKITAKASGVNVTKTLTVKHLVTLKTVTVKRSAKKLVLQATLSKVNKKYLKNKKVTFKFNGKTYTAKTNKKGVAKVTIKSTVLKKLKVGKKVTYQATYLKDTIKKTAKIKK